MRAVGIGQRGEVEFACVQHRQDAFAEARDQCVLAPLRAFAERRECGARFAAFADALEGLVRADFEQGIEVGGQCDVIEQVAAEDRDQTRLRQEWTQGQEHEMALRALPAPAFRGLVAEDAEVAIAARKHVVILRQGREQPRDREFRQRPQRGEIVEVGRHTRRDMRAKRALEVDRLAPLVVHRETIVHQIRARG